MRVHGPQACKADAPSIAGYRLRWWSWPPSPCLVSLPAQNLALLPSLQASSRRHGAQLARAAFSACASDVLNSKCSHATTVDDGTDRQPARAKKLPVCWWSLRHRRLLTSAIQTHGRTSSSLPASLALRAPPPSLSLFSFLRLCVIVFVLSFLLLLIGFLPL